MNWNDGRIVRIEIKDGKATVTDVPDDVTVLIINHDREEADRSLAGIMDKYDRARRKQE